MKNDDLQIPSWLADTDEFAPCPCGRPPGEVMVPIEGPYELNRLFHPECLPWLIMEEEND